MTAAQDLALHRLLNRRVVAPLLAAFAAPGVGFALLRADGKVFASAGDWPQSDLEALTALALYNGWLTAPDEQAVFQSGDDRIYPVWVGAQQLGVLASRGRADETCLTLERALRHSLATLLAEAVEKRSLTTEALDRYAEINLLYRVSETVGATLEAETLPRLVLDETSRVIPFDVGMVLLAPRQAVGEEDWEVKASFGSERQRVALLEIADDILKRVRRQGHPVMVTDALAEPPLDGSPSCSTILCVPLKTQDKLLGGILLGRLQGQSVFTAGDERLLLSLAHQAAITVENARLHQTALEKERLARELQLARDVQASLLPRTVPRLPGWDFAAHWQPAREVGGDFYDFIPGAGGGLGFAIADVSDKGMHAALFMALTRSFLRASALAAHSAAQCLAAANRLVCADAAGGMFVTLFYAQLDPAHSELTYVNAGHNPPLFYRAGSGQFAELGRTGIMLGFDDTWAFEQKSIHLRTGDFLVLYTDGVTEAVNADNEQFGEGRLRRVILAQAHVSADEVLRAVRQAMQDFMGAVAPFDDVTLVVVKRQ